MLSNVTDFKGRFMTGVFNPIDLHFRARGRRGHRLIMHISCRSAPTGRSPNRYEGNSEQNRFVEIPALVTAYTVNKTLGVYIYIRVSKRSRFFFRATSLIPCDLLWRMFVRFELGVSINNEWTVLSSKVHDRTLC